jgi:O-antigen/teichoic acid export membrane protein
VTSYLRTGSTAVVSLVMTPVLVAGLGTEAFGVWAVVNSLSVYRDVLQFGFVAATPKYVAEHTALRDHDGVRSAIATSFWILVGLGTLALLLGLGVAAAFPSIFQVPSDLHDSAQLLVVVMVIDFALSIPFNVFSGTLMGLQRYDLLNATQVAVWVSQAIGWAIVLAAGGGLVALGVVTAALSIGGQLSRYLIARRLVPGISVSPRRANRALVRPFAGLSIWLAIEDVTHILLTRIDVIVVGAVLGVGPAGVYSIAQKLTLALRQFVEPVSILFFPHSSELAALRDSAGIRRSVLAGTRLQLAIAAPLALTLATLAGPVIEAWVGPGFSAAVPVAVFLSATIVTWMLSNIGLTMLLGSGRARTPALIHAVEAGLNLGLSVLFAHLIGLEGVALGTFVAALGGNVIVLLPYVCRQFDMRIRDLIGPLIKAHAPAAAVALLVAWLVTRGDLTGAFALISAAAAVTASYLAVFAITGLDSTERRMLLARARPRSQPHAPTT